MKRHRPLNPEAVFRGSAQRWRLGGLTLLGRFIAWWEKEDTGKLRQSFLTCLRAGYLFLPQKGSL